MQGVPSGLEVGDVLEAVWDNGKTNVDHYEVTMVCDKEIVELRLLAAVSQPTGRATGLRAPLAGDHIGKPFLRYACSGRVRINNYITARKIDPLFHAAGVRVYAAAFWTAHE